MSTAKDFWTVRVRDPRTGALVRARGLSLATGETVFLTMRGALWNQQGLPGDLPETVAGLIHAVGASLEPELGEGADAAASILAADPRLQVDCLIAALVGDGPVARRNRAQALRQFPLLSHFLLMQRQPNMRVRFFPDLIADAIDGGKPLIPLLCELFLCSAWSIRHLRNKVPDDVAPYTSMRQLAQDLTKLIPERAPTRQGYALMEYLFASELYDHPWLAHAAMRSVINDGWAALGSRQGRVRQFRDYAAFVEALVGDLPGFTGHERPGAIDAALGHPTLGQIELLSDRWHAIEDALRQETAPGLRTADRHAPAWAPLIPKPQVIDGYEFRSLVDRVSLQEEGRALRHCVGGYGDRCAAGMSHIVAISQGGKRVATAELHVSGDRPGAQVDVVQLRGYRNLAVETPIADALNRLVAEIPGELLDQLPRPDPDYNKHRPAQGAAELFLGAVADRGLGTLERYRPCLQVSATKDTLWRIVHGRYALVDGCQDLGG